MRTHTHHCFPAGAKIWCHVFRLRSSKAQYNWFLQSRSRLLHLAVGYKSLHHYHTNTSHSLWHWMNEDGLSLSPTSHKAEAVPVCTWLGLVRGGKRLDLVHCTESSKQPVTLALKLEALWVNTPAGHPEFTIRAWLLTASQDVTKVCVTMCVSLCVCSLAGQTLTPCTRGERVSH